MVSLLKLPPRLRGVDCSAAGASLEWSSEDWATASDHAAEVRQSDRKSGTHVAPSHFTSTVGSQEIS